MANPNILRIKAILHPTKFEIRIEEFEAKETAKTYILPERSLFGINIAKGELMQVKTAYNQSSTLIAYHLHCLPKDKDEAVKSLTAKVSETLTWMATGVAGMQSAFEKGGQQP